MYPTSPPRTYRLAKYLDIWVKNRVNFISTHTIKHSVGLVNNIKNEKPPVGSSLVFFDVVGLFPHILKAPTLQFLSELLVKAHIPHQEIVEFFDHLNLCWTPNFCKFKNQFYEFPDEFGIPIGSSLGSLISEIFINKLEKPCLPHVAYWYRCVDDATSCVVVVGVDLRLEWT